MVKLSGFGIPRILILIRFFLSTKKIHLLTMGDRNDLNEIQRIFVGFSQVAEV